MTMPPRRRSDTGRPDRADYILPDDFTENDWLLGAPVSAPGIGSPPSLTAFNLADFLADKTPAPGFVVEGLFPRGDVTVLAARSGLGKSFLALQCALSVAAGRPFLGQAVQRGVAVGLFWEDPKYVLRDRSVELLPALGLSDGDVADRLILSPFNPECPERHVLWRNSAATCAYRRLEDDLSVILDPALLIIDTAKIAFADKIIDPEAVRSFIGELRALAAYHKVAVVLVTHVNRQGETSGTAEWENHARAVVHLKPHAGGARLEVVKTNYAAPIPPLLLARTARGAWIRADEAGPQGAGPAARPAVRPQRRSVADRARQAFLDGLDATTDNLSAKVQSPLGNYAPKRIAQMRCAKQLQVTQADLKVAMRTLLAEGLIVEVPGPGKHKTKVLARAAIEPGPALPSCASDSLPS